MQEDFDEAASALKRVAEMSSRDLVSEEDVKIKVVLPILRVLGYDDSDFKYEGRTGPGYVDVVVEHYPTGIVVESKAPRKRLDNYREQLQTYVLLKQRRNRVTIAILTDGDKFYVYGVTGAFYPEESLEDHRILSFTRSDLVTAAILPKLFDLLGKQSNQNGAIGDAIAGCHKGRERVGAIESELRALKAERERIDSRIHEIDGRIHDLEAERKEIPELSDRSRDKPKATSTPLNVYSRPASQHILLLLGEKEAFSQPQGVHRKLLDEQLINKVEGVHDHSAVSFGIMELRDKGKVDHEGGKNSGRPIGKVWLLGAHDKTAI